MQIVPLLDGEKLSLTTPGHLEVFFLGTGGAFSQSLGNTNLLFIQGDSHLLVDFGLTGPCRLWERARLKPTDIEAVFPTHVHADHAGGLENLGFQNFFIKGHRPRMFITEELQKTLWDDTLAGGMKYLTGQNRPMRLNDYFWVQRPVKIGGVLKFSVGPMEVKVFRTKHIEAPAGEPQFISYGLCVNNRVFFSGDSLFDADNIRQFGGYCEAYFHDCSIHPSGGTHATLDELRKGIQSESTKKRTFLVHYSDDYRSHDVSDFAGWAEAGLRYIFD